MAKRFSKSKIKLTKKQLAKINARFSAVAVVAKIAKKKKKKKKTARAGGGSRRREVVSFGGQAYTYALTSLTDPTSVSWTTKPAGYTYYPGEGIGADAPITSMRRMFRSETTFNDPGISSWDTSTVTNMSFMFQSAYAFNQDISSWNVSSVTNMSGMFLNAFTFSQDISSWNVSSVTNMSNMFNNADGFIQDISSWNVSSVTNMSFMFANVFRFNNGGVALTWTAGTGTANVTNMSYMFNNALAFNQDISSLNVNNVTNAFAFSSSAGQKGTLAANWQEAEHPSNVGLGNFYNL